MPVHEHKHRLPLENYHGCMRAAFTLCTDGREILFANVAICDCFLGILREAAKEHDCLNWAYVFMPDHLHLVMEGKSENADLWKMVIGFKQKSGFWLSRHGQGISWQKGFYDHLLRTDDELKRQIIYILDNPVRKSIVRDWQEYRFSGSLKYSKNELADYIRS